MGKFVSPPERVAGLLKKHGNYRAVSAVTGVALGQLHSIGRGRFVNLTPRTASKLGLEVLYWARGA